MTNHVHLAVQVGVVPLSRIMQNITFRYTRWHNWRQGRTGHLFQGRYKSFLVDADSYLQELVAYIHLNPLRAGLTAKSASYRWSSHRAYLGKEIIPWLNTEQVLATFASDLTKARRLYSDFVLERVKEGHREDFHGKGSVDTRVIGEDSFVEAALTRADSLLSRKPDLDAVIAAVRKMYGLADEELVSRGQTRLVAEARSMAAWAAQEFSSGTLTELAVRFGRDLSAVSASIRRLNERRKHDLELAEKVERLARELKVASCQA